MRFVKKVTPGIIQLVVFFYINYFYLIQVTNIRTISLMKKVQGLSIGFGCTITKYCQYEGLLQIVFYRLPLITNKNIRSVIFLFYRIK